MCTEYLIAEMRRIAKYEDQSTVIIKRITRLTQFW